MSKTKLFLALLIAVFLLSLLGAARPAQASGICYVSSWRGEVLTIRWVGAPIGAVNYFSVFRLDNLTTGIPLVTATEDYVGTDGDTYMWLIFMFVPDAWKLTELQAFADTPTGRVVQECYGTWYYSPPRSLFMPLVLN